MPQRLTKNKIEAILIVASIILTASILGGLISYSCNLNSTQNFVTSFKSGAIIAGAIFSIISLISILFGTDLVLIATNAERTKQADDPTLHRIINEHCKTLQIDKPQIFTLPEFAINSCSAGITKGNSFIAVTKGFRKYLSIDEQRATIAHEVAHIKNGDNLIYTLTSVLLGSLVLISDYTRKNVGSLLNIKSITGIGFIGSFIKITKLVFLLIILLGSFWITPTISSVIRLAISKSRDLEADKLAKQLSNSSDYNSALNKISQDSEPFIYENRALGHMFFSNPNIQARQLENVKDLFFSTRPTLSARLNS